MHKIFKGLVYIIFFLITLSLYSQNISDLSKVDVDQLEDAQIQAYAKKAEDSGLTIQQLELLARQRGMSADQASKLRARIQKIQSNTNGQTLRSNSERLRSEALTKDKVDVFDELARTSSGNNNKLQIFGTEIFESALAFQTPSNVATPDNYVLGPGDELLIDVFGASEFTYQELVSPDGKIFLKGIGPISVGGISIKAARSRVFSTLSSIYSGMKGSKPNTFVEISLGDIKTISVNVVGNVQRPGTYVVSSFSSAFNVLYEAGGPSSKGSMRSVEVIRSGEKIAELDIYRYFYDGDVSNNPILRDGDVLVVKSFMNRVVYSGKVKQPAIYELIQGESFMDLVSYSGGTNAEGYDEHVTIHRSKGEMRSLITVTDSALNNILLKDGDSIYISKVSSNYSNRVRLEGAVEHAGFYELKSGMTLSALLKIGVVSDDAFLDRGNIVRLRKDFVFSNVSFNTQEVLDGKIDYVLENEDLVKIPTILEIEDRKRVTILGEVNNPGEYPFVDELTVEDLITISGGLKASANTNSIEVARRVSKDSKEFKTAIIFNYSIAEDLGLDSASAFKLQPFDLITIKASALFRTQRTITIEGEVLKPGTYALETENDKLVDVIERAGGLTQFAYPEGASLIRDLYYSAENDSETTSTGKASFYRKKQLDALLKRDSVNDLGSERLTKEGVGIQLADALKNPNSKYNLILQDGDVLSIPKQLQTVRVRGEVLYPTRVSYDKGSNFKDYISLAGGFGDNARIKKSYVVYANGRAERTRKFLFFKSFPNIEPGADIFIPEKPKRRPLTTGEVLGITSGLASLSLVILQIINITN
ncbi:MAG: SLBB domain-containing protein [Ekhidna sp.]|nr:SLBB domain-containing protein [Ekhidna sp.]